MNIDELKQQLPRIASSEKYFDTQREGEEVLLIIRKHWIVDVLILLKFVFLIGLPFILIVYLKYWTYVLDSEFADVFMLLFSIYLLYMLLYCYVQWVKENLDFIIFTSERVIDINQNSLFNRESSETELRDIQDAHAQVKGLIGSLLKYGNLTIQTAAEHSFFFMKYVKSPSKVVTWLLAIRDWSRDQHIQRNN